MITLQYLTAHRTSEMMPLKELLQTSLATPDFRKSVEAFADSGRPNQRVVFELGTPAIKVHRTITKLLAAYPTLQTDFVEINGISGCDFFRGSLTVRTTDEAFCVDFDWNCRWRAIQEGWTDYFGFPDQIRAAREFGYDCFRTWDARQLEVFNAASQSGAARGS